MSETLTIRPYARLITMLGDQLIKNERIALVELIKNAYDADADWVKVSFVGFNEDFSVNEESRIIIEDNGVGMNREIIEKHWLNPATPEKAKRKRERNITDKGRIIQGEKGIGRFAIFKLGKRVEICSRRKLQDLDGRFCDAGETTENVVTYDFTEYDEDFSYKDDPDRELFIDELKVEFQEREPRVIIAEDIDLGAIDTRRSPYGTRITISALKTNWTRHRVDRIQSEVGKLQPIFSEVETQDFRVLIYKGDEVYRGSQLYKEKFLNCLATKAVFRITRGHYDEAQRRFDYDCNGAQKVLRFDDLKGLDAFRDYFKDEKGEPDASYQTECGNFGFQFYIFDLAASEARYRLDAEEATMVKEHRIYLYRDGVRVLPYGDPDDDWLKIDMMRGTKSAAYYLSNDQVVGCVDISQENNPRLRDKTNREGLLDEGKALEDFIHLLQVLLRQYRMIDYKKYLDDKKRRRDQENEKNGKPQELLNELKAKTQKNADDATKKMFASFEKSYQHEKQVYDDRIRKTENLAAVGLSVETASHDIMIVLKNTLDQIRSINEDLRSSGEVNKGQLCKEMLTVESNMDLIYSQMKDIRLLFPSAKKKASNISVRDILSKVSRMYQKPFERNRITLSQEYVSGDLVIKATDAVLLQVFINLFDNALYWLKTTDGERKVSVLIDRNDKSIIFADNGPGVKEESVPYIFEAFYSEKGEDGRGLGLYIARQLLDRYDYTIRLITNPGEKVLTGANFCIEHVEGE